MSSICVCSEVERLAAVWLCGAPGAHQHLPGRVREFPGHAWLMLCTVNPHRSTEQSDFVTQELLNYVTECTVELESYFFLFSVFFGFFQVVGIDLFSPRALRASTDGVDRGRC